MPPRKNKVEIVVLVENCGSCKFRSGNNDDKYGFCRRYPPIPVAVDEDGEAHVWPVTHDDEWCGEFSRKLDS